MKARCKFRVVAVTDFGNDNKLVKLTTQYDQTLPEDQSFSRYTPSGTIEVQISNPAVLPMFEPGRDFYVDLVPAEQVGA
jgi:hypothetical protein